MLTIDRPVLISQETIGERITFHGYHEDDPSDRNDTARGFPLSLLQSAIDRKQLEPRHGVYEAAELILSQQAVVINHINTDTQPKRSIYNDSLYKGPDRRVLGFNDHHGGTEAYFKVTLNDLEAENSDVLWAPPGSTNTTFHRAIPAYPTWESRGIEDLTNPAKTVGAAHDHGRDYYDFYLVGDNDTPHQFRNVFQEAGFTFVPETYSFEEYRELASLDRPEPFVRIPEWPGDQFSTQIEQIRLLESAALRIK